MRHLGAVLLAVALLKVPYFPDTTDQCGPATLASVLSFWGKAATPASLKQEMYDAKLRGTLPMDLVATAKTHGLTTEMVRGEMTTLQAEIQAGRPVLAMLDVGFAVLPVHHYVVVTGFDDARKGFYVHSAGKENQFMSYKKFQRQWEKADSWAMLAKTL